MAHPGGPTGGPGHNGGGIGGGNRGNGGGVGPHGGRSFGGVGSATPGGWGFGGNQISGGGYYGGPRRQQGTIATRPATVGNLMAAGSFLGATGPFRALGMALSGMDPYSGPVGQAHFSGADTPGSMLGTLRPGLMQPQQPQMAPGQMVPGPMQPPQVPPQPMLPQTQVPGRYLGVAPGYGVQIPGYGYL